MKHDNRACENAVSGIPVSYMRVEYIRHNIFEPILMSLCLISALCFTILTAPLTDPLCSKMAYLHDLSYILEETHNV